MKTLCVSYDSCAGLGQGQVPARNNNASIRSSGLLAGGSVVVRDETANSAVFTEYLTELIALMALMGFSGR